MTKKRFHWPSIQGRLKVSQAGEASALDAGADFTQHTAHSTQHTWAGGGGSWAFWNLKSPEPRPIGICGLGAQIVIPSAGWAEVICLSSIKISNR